MKEHNNKIVTNKNEFKNFKFLPSKSFVKLQIKLHYV